MTMRLPLPQLPAPPAINLNKKKLNQKPPLRPPSLQVIPLPPSTEQHLLAPATASTPGTGSPRESSEESYDMLSSSRTSNVGEPPVKVKERARRTEEDDDDSGSDWE